MRHAREGGEQRIQVIQNEADQEVHIAHVMGAIHLLCLRLLVVAQHTRDLCVSMPDYVNVCRLLQRAQPSPLILERFVDVVTRRTSPVRPPIFIHTVRRYLPSAQWRVQCGGVGWLRHSMFVWVGQLLGSIECFSALVPFGRLRSMWMASLLQVHSQFSVKRGTRGVSMDVPVYAVAATHHWHRPIRDVARGRATNHSAEFCRVVIGAGWMQELWGVEHLTCCRSFLVRNQSAR